jgi:hypothetical protein
MVVLLPSVVVALWIAPSALKVYHVVRSRVPVISLYSLRSEIPSPFAYAQNAGSSHLTMACPSRVVLAASIGKIPEQENRLLRIITCVGLGTLFLLVIGVMVGQWMLRTKKEPQSWLKAEHP